MALDAAKKIKSRFGDLVELEEFKLDSDEGKAFKVTTSTNVFVNDQLLPLPVWLDQDEFENHIQELLGEDSKIEREVIKHEGYDVVIVGGGPAGLTAGIYCARARLRAILLEGSTLGGQVVTTDNIENYPGLMNISGVKLIADMEKQARHFGLEIQVSKKVHKIDLNQSLKTIYTGEDVYSCKAIILACGLSRSELGLPGEAEFSGKGVSYCAVCDANFFGEKRVAVVGGGDTAIEDAIYLSKFASQVFVIHRRDELRATKILQETALCNNKIEILWSHVPQEILGNSTLEGINIKDLKTGNSREIELEGLFIAVGSHPHTEFLEELGVLDEQGYVIVDDKMSTSIPGVFAAGDIRVSPLKQVATAVGDGAIAAISAERYITEKISSFM